MASVTIKTRRLGSRTFEVSERAHTLPMYVYLQTSKGRMQICEGGGYLGDTLSATNDSLERVARRWHRQNLRQSEG